VSLGFKKAFVTITMLIILPFALSGCQKKPKTVNCQYDSDCRLDASGQVLNGVCVLGKCEECAKHSDCSDLKQCVNNRCLSACKVDGDCGINGRCENNYCVAECTNNDGCGSGQVCSYGRCVADNSNGNAWAEGDCQDLANIHFDFDKTDVKAEEREQVNKLFKCLESRPHLSVLIEGHADNRGTKAYNMALAQARADSLRQYLNKLGIALSRLKTVSHGDQKPLIQENTEYAWQQNRRANFVLEGNAN
jgi:outer membrane protein OmpA-like peptidoglycan-associated protein